MFFPKLHPILRGILTEDKNRRLNINGEPVDPETLIRLQESARAALDNQALKLIRDQVRFKAIDDGYLKNSNPSKDQDFYKSALWYVQEEVNLLKQLAGG